MGDHGQEKDNVPELSYLFKGPRLPDAHSSYSESKYVVFGVPFDGTSSFRRGSRLGPASVRYAYDNLESFDPYYGVNFLDVPIADMGDLEVGEDAGEVVDSVQEATSRILSDGKIPIMIGGEHSITTGVIRNLREASMIIIDAHSDFRESYMGNRNNHACVTRRALEILGEGRIFSIGTRSISMEEYESPEFHKVRFYSASMVRERGISSVIREIRNSIKGKVYISIDMDGIDPAYAPGVGTPEPYGLSDTDVKSVINAFAKDAPGFDVLEFTPVYDNGNTSMLAAKLIQDFIGSRESKGTNADFWNKQIR
ncbi:agmatinase [Thermoplasmatales archaeon]|nr:agmatinase [Thermoplasmatales archaeon]